MRPKCLASSAGFDTLSVSHEYVRITNNLNCGKMFLTLMYIFHEYIARTFIPYYNIKFETREAANCFVYNWEHRKVYKPNSDGR